MVYENLAKCYCDLCGKFIKEERVVSPSKNRQVKVVFDICTDCRRELNYEPKEHYSYYDTLSILYAYARVLRDRFFVMEYERSLLGEFARDLHLIFSDILSDERKRRSDFKEILKEVRGKLILLNDATAIASEIVRRYENRISLIEVLKIVPSTENIVIRFKNFLYQKMKRNLSRL